MHLFFFCPVARVTWFAFPFALRVHSLPLNFTTTLLDITQHFHDEQIVDFCNLLWNLWKARNEEVFAGKEPQPKAIISRAKAMNIPHQATRGLALVPTLVHIPRGAKTMLVDASWDTSKRTGLGVTCFDETGALSNAFCYRLYTTDPFHAEAHALLKALQMVQDQHSNTTTLTLIFSDCKKLVQAIQTHEVEELSSWRARETVSLCIDIWRNVNHITHIHHVKREALVQPHQLANAIRTAPTNSSAMELVEQLQMERHLLNGYFRVYS